MSYCTLHVGIRYFLDNSRPSFSSGFVFNFDTRTIHVFFSDSLIIVFSTHYVVAIQINKTDKIDIIICKTFLFNI